MVQASGAAANDLLGLPPGDWLLEVIGRPEPRYHTERHGELKVMFVITARSLYCIEASAGTGGTFAEISLIAKVGGTLMDLRKTTSRRSLFAPALLLLLAPKLRAKSGKPDVTLAVGALFSLTGNSANLGTQSKLMMQIAAGEMDALLGDFNLNPPSQNTGIEFNLMFADTLLDPTTAANEARGLINQGVQFLIGPQTSAEVAAVKPITDAAGVVLISQGSTASSLSIAGDTVFRFVPDDTLESKAIASAAAGMGIKTIVPVWRADAGNQGLAASLKNFGPGLGITVSPGFEYATTTTDFSTIANQLSTAVGSSNLSEVAVFVAGFDEAASLLRAASGFSNLGSVRWLATDGIALSSAFLAPGPAAFAEMTQLAAANLGLPAEAQLLRDPIIQQSGIASPIPFAFAAFDAFVCATLAWLLAGEDRTKVRDILAPVAQQHFGTTGWALLNAFGDRAIGNFEFFGIRSMSGVPQWTALFAQQVS